MFKEGQTWLITMLDLVLLMICFFVLIYSFSKSKILQGNEEENYKEQKYLLKSATIATPLQLIYRNLQATKSKSTSEINFKVDQYVRVIPHFESYNFNDLEIEAEKLAYHLYNFPKNLIKVQLLIDYQSYENENLNKGSNIELALKKIIEQATNFRNLLAKSANNDKIVTTIDLYSSFPSLRGKTWMIVVDIFSEPC